MDPATIGMWVAALTPVAGGIGLAVTAIAAARRASAAARLAAAELQRADRELIVSALLEAARADAELRASIEAALDEVRAAAAWHQGTVYRTRDPVE